MSKLDHKISKVSPRSEVLRPSHLQGPGPQVVPEVQTASGQTQEQAADKIAARARGWAVGVGQEAETR